MTPFAHRQTARRARAVARALAVRTEDVAIWRGLALLALGASVALGVSGCASTTRSAQPASVAAVDVAEAAPAAAAPSTDEADPPPSPEALTELLDRLVAYEAYPEVLGVLGTPWSAEADAALETWAVERLRRGEASAVLAQPYARRLAAQGRGEEANFWFLYGAITLQVDAARCDDPSAPKARIAGWRANTAEAAEAFEAQPVETQKLIAEAVFRFEANLAPTRSIDRWLCAEGDEYWSAYFEKYPERLSAPDAELPRDLTIPVHAVPEPEWASRRADILEAWRATLVERVDVRSLGRPTRAS